MYVWIYVWDFFFPFSFFSFLGDPGAWGQVQVLFKQPKSKSHLPLWNIADTSERWVSDTSHSGISITCMWKPYLFVWSGHVHFIFFMKLTKYNRTWLAWLHCITCWGYREDKLLLAGLCLCVCVCVCVLCGSKCIYRCQSIYLQSSIGHRIPAILFISFDIISVFKLASLDFSNY